MEGSNGGIEVPLRGRRTDAVTRASDGSWLGARSRRLGAGGARRGRISRAPGLLAWASDGCWWLRVGRIGWRGVEFARPDRVARRGHLGGVRVGRERKGGEREAEGSGAGKRKQERRRLATGRGARAACSREAAAWSKCWAPSGLLGLECLFFFLLFLFSFQISKYIFK
jgi:hypothetical protein